VALLTLPCANYFANAQKSSSTLKLSTVVIDPGHGGKDPGCISPDKKTSEKTIVLDISKRLAAKIKAGYPDVKVIQTRNNDSFVELQGRADIANRNKGNLFISIHVNSVDGKRNGPNGYSVHILGQFTSKNKDLYAVNMDVVRRENSVIKLEDDYNTKYEGFDPSDQESYIFMNLMQNAFLEQSLQFAQEVDTQMKGGAIHNSRGISQDPFWVLWRTAMPAVLVECGFMSNSDDRAALNSEEGRERIASDLYDAFKKFKKSFDGTLPVNETVSSTKKQPFELKEEKPAEEKTEYAATTQPEQKGETTTAAPTSYYGAQVLVSSKQMGESDPFFKGNKVATFPIGKVFKYVLILSEDLAEARNLFKETKKLYPDSFLVKVEDGAVSAVK